MVQQLRQYMQTAEYCLYSHWAWRAWLVQILISIENQKTIWWQTLCLPWQSSSNCAQPLSVFLSSVCGGTTTLLFEWTVCWTMGIDCFRNPASRLSELGEHGSCRKYILQMKHILNLFHGRTRTADLYRCVWSGITITPRVHSGMTKPAQVQATLQPLTTVE